MKHTLSGEKKPQQKSTIPSYKQAVFHTYIHPSKQFSTPKVNIRNFTFPQQIASVILTGNLMPS